VAQDGHYSAPTFVRTNDLISVTYDTLVLSISITMQKSDEGDRVMATYYGRLGVDWMGLSQCLGQPDNSRCSFWLALRKGPPVQKVGSTFAAR
jgi:hypothetical protein